MILYAVTAVNFKQDKKDRMSKITRGLITKKITKRITHHKGRSPWVWEMIHCPLRILADEEKSKSVVVYPLVSLTNNRLSWFPGKNIFHWYLYLCMYNILTIKKYLSWSSLIIIWRISSISKRFKQRVNVKKSKYVNKKSSHLVKCLFVTKCSYTGILYLS